MDRWTARLTLRGAVEAVGRARKVPPIHCMQSRQWLHLAAKQSFWHDGILSSFYHIAEEKLLLRNAASFSWDSRKGLIIRWQMQATLRVSLHPAGQQPLQPLPVLLASSEAPHTLKEVCCDLHPVHCGIVITPCKPWYCCNWLAVSQWLHPDTALHGFRQNTKRIRSGVFSVNIKNGLKHSSFKKLQNLEFLLNATFLPELLTPWNQSLPVVYGETSYHLDQKPNTQVKECHLFMYKKPLCSGE